MRKKLFTLLTLMLGAYSCAFAQGTYGVKSGDAGVASGTQETSVDNITMTWGVSGDDAKVNADFKGGNKSNTALKDLLGATAFCEGNGANGSVTGGTVYFFEPAIDGTLSVGIVLNSDKAFFVQVLDGEEWVNVPSFKMTKADGTSVTLENGGKLSEKLTGGVVIFDVEAGKKYAVYCPGSKLGYYGFKFEAAVTDPVIKAADATILTVESGVEVYKEIEVTGKNLSGTTLTASLVPAIFGMNVELTDDAISAGAISTTAKITYSATENDHGTTTLTLSDGTTSVDYTITYKANISSHTLESVSDATTWNFSKLTANTGSAYYVDKRIKLTEESNPAIGEEFVYADYDGTLYSAVAGFDPYTIAFAGTYPLGADQYCQDGILKIKTEVSGTIVVEFSDTGKSIPESGATDRHLMLNGLYTESFTKRDGDSNGQKLSEAVIMPAGEITIGSSEATCIYSVTFTPDYAPSQIRTLISDAGYATFASQYELKLPEGVEAYIAHKIDGGKVILKPVTGGYIPAATPVVLKGEAGYYTMDVTETGAVVGMENLLVGCIGDCTPRPSLNYYTLAVNDGKPVFKKSSKVGKLEANKAFIVVPVATEEARELTLDFSEVTGINEVNGEVFTVNDYFNLNGQRISQPTKGLFIQNGKKQLMK